MEGLKVTTDLFKKWADQHQEINRPNWDNYFLSLAKLISTRSHDAETRHGCCLVDTNNRLVSFGYNGFGRDIPDGLECYLPNIRPTKYPFMLHSEANAIFNAARNGVSLNDCKAYVTGITCNPCLMSLWQAGIKEIICISGYELRTNSTYDVNEDVRKIFIEATGIKITEITPDFTFAKELFSGI